jgi:nucleolar protein 12
VEKALLFNDKKFPPLLPRKLRVSRAKKSSSQPKEAAKQTSAKKGSGLGRWQDRKGATGSNKGKMGKSRGRAVRDGRDKTAAKSAGGKEKAVFEGYRATSKTNKMNLKTKGKKKPEGRSAKRAAAFKAGGQKKKRDM